MAFVVVGVTGLVVAPAVLALLGLRQAVPAPEAPTASGAGASARGVAPLLKKRSIQLILAGSACISVAGYAHTTFAPALLMRAHGMTVGEVGVQYGIANCTAGVLALLFTGRVADRLSRRDPRWLLWCMAAAPILQMPLTLLGFTVGDRTQAVWFLALATIAASIWLPLTVAAMQRVTPPAQRATASAVLLFCAALFGSAGPLAAGMLSDALTPTLGAKSLPHALLLMNPAMHVLAAAFFFLAARSYRADLLPEEAKG
jgi:MFS family permease